MSRDDRVAQPVRGRSQSIPARRFGTGSSTASESPPGAAIAASVRAGAWT